MSLMLTHLESDNILPITATSYVYEVRKNGTVARPQRLTILRPNKHIVTFLNGYFIHQMQMKISRLGTVFQLSDKYKIYFYVALVFICIIAGVRIKSEAGFGVVAGGIAGVIGHLKVTWISQSIISPEQAVALDQILNLMGYRRTPSSSTNESVWIPKIHRLLRFDAQNVAIQREQASYKVTAPFYILKRIKNKI